MGWSTGSSSRALKGVHGLQLAPNSPFTFREISQDCDGHLSTYKSSEPVGGNNRVFMQRIWQQRPACLKPIHCNCQGENLAETIANVLTSIPFIALGIQAPRKNFSSTLYANSLIGVGLASSLYHSSRGEIRKYMRWADYTMIATSTVCLSRALRDENPRFLMAASALLLPIQPLMVSAVHTGMMEVAFAKKALVKPELRVVHNLHTMSTLLGGALFVVDDIFPRTPYVHAAWHLAAAICVGTCNKLLE